eukprot:6093539-Amphidinium_carterae.1
MCFFGSLLARQRGWTQSTKNATSQQASQDVKACTKVCKQNTCLSDVFGHSFFFALVLENLQRWTNYFDAMCVCGLAAMQSSDCSKGRKNLHTRHPSTNATSRVNRCPQYHCTRHICQSQLVCYHDRDVKPNGDFHTNVA